jgi:hypothetical protein
MQARSFKMELSYTLTLLENTILELAQGYQKYNTLAKQQQGLLLTNNALALQSLLEDMADHANHLQYLEDQRISLLATLGAKHKQEIVSLAQLSTLYPGAVSDSLFTAAAQLKTELRLTAQINQTNSLLIENARGIIRGTLAIVTGVAGRTKQHGFKTYNKTGSNSPGQRQIRSLINKKG